MAFDVVLQLIISGLLTGGTFVVVAIGLSLVFGVMNILNVAHGALYALGGYLGYTFSSLLHFPPVASFFLTIAAAFAIGALLERATIERIKLNTNAVIMLTFGLAWLIEEVIIFVYGPAYQGVPGMIQGAIVVAGSIVIALPRLLAFSVSLLFAFLLIVFVYRTKTGSAIRVVSFSSELASLRGINVRRISMITFGISSALVAAAAALIAPTQSVYPDVGWDPLLNSFVIVILGGMGSLLGTIVGGLLYGVVFVLGGFYVGAQWEEIIVLLMVILVLLLRPSGILGQVVERV